MIQLCVNHELLKYLKDEVRRLKRKVSRLEDESAERKKERTSEEVRSEPQSPAVSSEPHPPAVSSEYIAQPLVLASDNFQQSVSKALNAIFSVDELQNCSVSGKKSPKTTGPVRPPLPTERLDKVYSAVLQKFPGSNKKEINEKVQNVQKVLRRK